MNIHEATQLYEKWLAEHIDLVREDLDLKHKHMQEDRFQFMRATYYRWAQKWQIDCPQLANAPSLLSVGDLHVENFGTWRDYEGRLVWGINDFDEASVLPWTADLLRLATSVLLAIDADHLSLGRNSACNAIVQGYREALTDGGRPFILAEDHDWLRAISLTKLRSPAAFWQRFDEFPPLTDSIPSVAQSALKSMLPEPDLPHRVVHRVAGLGSLGRQRFVAIADWKGGRIAREAKALAPSACVWASQDTAHDATQYQKLLDASVRMRDSFVRVVDDWIVRRLAPDCIRVELASLPTNRDELRMLYSMGYETGNVHLAEPDIRDQVLNDLKARPKKWLIEAARTMSNSVTRDWNDWRKSK